MDRTKAESWNKIFIGKETKGFYISSFIYHGKSPIAVSMFLIETFLERDKKYIDCCKIISPNSLLLELYVRWLYNRVKRRNDDQKRRTNHL